MSVDEVEPIEAEAAEENAVATRGTHLASTQTVTHEYLTQSGKVMRETVRTDGTVTSVLDFIYDESGKPFAMIDQLSAQPKTYYYVLNLQGDVVKLIDQDGAEVAAYAYDAWGNLLSATGGMAYTNPLRYRGYYYDAETRFYYLQSRYYDPVYHRFINADVYSSTDSSDAVSCNMFAYCGNNPTSRSDETGDFWNFIVGAVVGAVVNAVTTAIESYEETGHVDWGNVAISAATGAVGGAVAASGLGALAQAGITAGANFVGSMATELHSQVKQGGWKSVSWGKTIGKSAISAGASFCTSLAGSALGKVTTGALEDQGRNLILKGTRRGMSMYTKRELARFAVKGKQFINTARGITSVMGTLATWPTNAAVSTVLS